MPTSNINPRSVIQNVLRIAAALSLIMVASAAETSPSPYVKKSTWEETMLATRDAFQTAKRQSVPPMKEAAPTNPGACATPKPRTQRSEEEKITPEDQILEKLEADFPLQWDWLLQDTDGNAKSWFEKPFTDGLTRSLVQRVIKEVNDPGTGLQSEFDKAAASSAPDKERIWLELYERACQARRSSRLHSLAPTARRVVFTKHFNLGGSHYAYTEALSDGQAEKNFEPGSALCVLEIDGAKTAVRALIEDAKGVIRDPAVSYDGKRVLFSWKKSRNEDDYHLYEMEMETGKVRQLTSGLGNADYEGTYLPNGDILFNSTRCVQSVDCWWTEVSNLHACDKDGRFLRRVTFDQVHDNYPTVLDDGRVTYTRWEYNDRGQVYPQALFQMNSDGTGQTEFYGNNSWFPTSILHARGIPGTRKVVAIASGHHCMQAGKLIVIDPSKGRQEAQGVQLIAPVRETVAEKIDAYGQTGELFQHPFPLGEQAFLVGYHPLGWQARSRRFHVPHFKIYAMANDGRRELLASDPAISCNQPVLLAARPVPPARAGMVDFHKSTGTFYMQNVYVGGAMTGVEKGTVKRLRVVGLDFRAASAGHNGNSGPAGGAMVSTPPSIDHGAWDPKIVFGDATVYDDGSAFFEAPARTPVYFQALDAKGHVVQTMRSWSTLQPGENASCVGCHEDKNSPALATRGKTQAIVAGAQRLKPFYGPARGFSFSREIQPILDRNCVGCHHDRKGLSLLGDTTLDPKAKRLWSDAYLALTAHGKSTPFVNWINVQSAPPMLPPYSAGSAKSSLFDLLEKGHYKVKLTCEDLDKLACWIDLLVPFCGDYTEANAWSPGEHQLYESRTQKRRHLQEAEREQIAALLALEPGESAPGNAVQIALIDGNGNVASAPRAFQPGDRLEITGSPRMMVRIGNLPETLIYSPEGRVSFPIPFEAEAKAYPPDAFGGAAPLFSARPATPAEVSAARNLALNPYDVRGISTFFPHATSNSECRNQAVFCARNAIDGIVGNLKHGAWPNQSWGPEKRTDLWWHVDFGRAVEVEKLVLRIRADFPHDQSWTCATIRFSDGSSERIEIRKTAEPQTFAFGKRTASWLRLEDLAGEQPIGWRALTEVEVYGRE